MIKFKKTKKYQSGGGIPLYQAMPNYPLYTRELGNRTQQSTVSPAKSTMTKESGGDKDIKGLPADLKARDMLLQKAAKYESQMTELDILSNTKIFQDYQRLMNKANDPTLIAQIESNLKNYDTFVKDEVSKKASAYVTQGGKVIAQDDKGNLNYYSPAEIAEKGYRPLTVNEVASKRRSDVRFSALDGNDVLFDGIKTSSSRADILKQIQSGIESKLGSEEGKIILEGQKVIEQAAKKQGLEEFESTWKNNKAAVKAATISLSFLNENQLAQLQMQAIEKGAKTPQEIQTMMLKIMYSPFDAVATSSSTTKMVGINDDSKKGSGKEGSGQVGSWLYSWKKLNSGGGTDITVGTGDASFRTKGQVITGWKGKSDSPLLVANDAINNAGEVSKAYTLDGKKLKDFQDGYLYNGAIIAPGTEVSYTYLPVDSEGKPAVTEDNIKNLEKFNRVYKENYAKTGNTAKAAAEARKQTGIQAIRVEPFIATTLLSSHQFDSSFNVLSWGEKQFGFEKADKSTKQRYQEALKIDNLDPFGPGDREVYQFTAYIPLSDEEGILRADQSVRAPLSTLEGKKYNENEFYPTPLTDFNTSGLDDQPE